MEDQKYDAIIERLDRIQSAIICRPPRPVSVPEAAEQLGVSPHWLRDLCKKGMIPAASKGVGVKNKHYVVDMNNIELFMKNGGCDAAVKQKFERKRKQLQTK